MLLGIGTDIVENIRIQRLLEEEGERFLNKVFTPAEVAICTGGKGLKVHSLAARFAAKEAVAKAFGTGIGRVRWKDIEVNKDVNGAPVVTLSGEAGVLAEKKGVAEIQVSLSHTADYSVAFAVLEG